MIKLIIVCEKNVKQNMKCSYYQHFFFCFINGCYCVNTWHPFLSIRISYDIQIT